MKYIEAIVNQWEDSYLATQWPNRVKGGMIEWASRRQWQVFWTQTFRVSTSVSGARAKWLRFLADFNSRLLPMAATQTQVAECLWVTEPHSRWASNHVHALLSMSPPISLKTYESVWRCWKEEAWKQLGKAFILQTKPNAYVWYVLKYLTKEAKGIDWRTLPVWDRRKQNELGRAARSATRPPPMAEKTWGIWSPYGQNDAMLLDKEIDQ